MPLCYKGGYYKLTKLNKKSNTEDKTLHFLTELNSYSITFNTLSKKHKKSKELYFKMEEISLWRFYSQNKTYIPKGKGYPLEGNLLNCLNYIYELINQSKNDIFNYLSFCSFKYFVDIK